jgi:hypothetical protein
MGLIIISIVRWPANVSAGATNNQRGRSTQAGALEKSEALSEALEGELLLATVPKPYV